ncbi:hypothetical protein [Sphingomonas sp.]|uniref:hypothetical protein n=1 Tax=Sphingomonas sp. TaxID=28214 RepID=UPI0014775DD4
MLPRSTSLALPKPEGLATPEAEATEEPQAGVAGVPTDAVAPAKSGHAYGHASDAGGGGDGGGSRHVVDERVTETDTMRITVISYSDGSVDRLNAIKDGGGAAMASIEPRGASGWGNRGVMVDRVG